MTTKMSAASSSVFTTIFTRFTRLRVEKMRCNPAAGFRWFMSGLSRDHAATPPIWKNEPAAAASAAIAISGTVPHSSTSAVCSSSSGKRSSGRVKSAALVAWRHSSRNRLKAVPPSSHSATTTMTKVAVAEMSALNTTSPRLRASRRRWGVGSCSFSAMAYSASRRNSSTPFDGRRNSRSDS